MANNDNLFKRLTGLFRSGPTIKKRVKNIQNTRATSPSSMEMFKKAHSDVYNSTLSAYGSYDRMARYSDFSEMEATPEISSALDIYAEECVSQDESGNVLHIYSDNRRVKELLENLFYDVLNVDFNLVMWARNLCKYGDFFLFNDISPEYGVVNAFPIPIAEIEREEGFDPDDPGAVRFRWITQGNRILENWQISHFRLLGNDAFLPYGSSILEGARRIWRQLILIEDAMLVYRVIRSPERRVFYIDVGNIPPENVADYLQQAQTSLKRNAVVDKTTGQVDLRYNPLSVDEDYFLPVRGGDTGTRIDSLAGGANTGDIEDVEYIQKKLFASLKIPKAYLGYDEDIGAKATLAQEDIRFSRTIQRIQKTIISELNKLAMIHLYSHGYESEDLMNFELRLSNPSSIAQIQKLELIRTKFDIASSIPEGFVDKEWVQKNIFDFNDSEINRIKLGLKRDKIEEIELEKVQPRDNEIGFGDEDEEEAGGGDEGEKPSGLFAADINDGNLLDEDDDNNQVYKEYLDESDDNDDDDEKDNKIKTYKTMSGEKRPVTANKSASNIYQGNNPFKGTDLSGGANKIDRDPFGVKSVTSTGLSDSVMPRSKVINDFLDHKMQSVFKNMDQSFGNEKKSLLKENVDSDDILIDMLNELEKEDS